MTLIARFTFWYFLIFSSTISFAQWKTVSFQGSKVYLYIPLSSSPQSSLMINLHGCAQKANVLKEHGNWEEAADVFDTIIAIPEVPNGGVIAGCWDYYGLNHTRTNRHNKFILELTKGLLNEYSVSSENVFISGLSSGAGLSLVLGCLAPDIFKGLGLNAGPSVGTSSGEISRARISVNQIEKNCLQLAGVNRQHLLGQKASVIYGNNDFLVDPNYNRRNAEALANIYGANKQEALDISSLPGSNTQGGGLLYKKANTKQPIVSIIENKGLGHNWPAGQGGSSRSFVNKNSLNYPFYLLKFLKGLDQ